MDLALNQSPPAAARTRWAPVIALGLAMLIVSIEITLSAVTLPLIGTELDVGVSATAWVMLAYALPGAALAVPAGRWVDGADLRAVFLLAVTGVGVTSVLAAVAPTFGALIAARVLQGILGALVAACYMPLVHQVVPAERRGRALGAIATIMPLGSMGGAALGGLAADALGWRAVFLIKLPLLVVVLWLGFRAVPSRPGGLPPPNASLLREAVLLGGAVTGLMLALDRAERAPVVAALIAAPGLAAGFAWTRLAASRPLIGLVRRPAFGLQSAALMFGSAYTGLSLFLLPFFVSDVLRASPGLMGVALLFFVGAVAAISPGAGAATDRFGPRPVAFAGIVVALGGALSFLGLGPGAGLADLAWRVALLGAGQALFSAPNNVALLAAAPADLVGAAGGVGLVARTVGMAAGPVVTALAWNAAGGGAAGFRAGVLVVVASQLIAALALLAARPR